MLVLQWVKLLVEVVSAMNCYRFRANIQVVVEGDPIEIKQLLHLNNAESAEKTQINPVSLGYEVLHAVC